MIDINGSYVTTLSGFVPSPFQNYENLYSASFPRRELKPKAGRLAAGGGFKLRFLLAAEGIRFFKIYFTYCTPYMLRQFWQLSQQIKLECSNYLNISFLEK